MNKLDKLDIRKKRIALKKNKFTSKEFIEKNIWIVNKQKEKQLLKLNAIQNIIDSKIEELVENGIPPRIIILKARQEGVTTYFQGKIIADSVNNKNRNNLIVSHEAESTAAIFEKTKFMYDNLPENVKPTTKKSNSKVLFFENRLNSKISVKIAGKESIGRSDTYSYVHLSEFAYWKGSGENSPGNQLAAIMNAIPEDINSIAVIESTARGFNSFKVLWDDACSGLNCWTPLFFPWWKQDEYMKEFSSKEERDLFFNSLDEYEQEIKLRFSLNLEQLNWYRHTKKIKCNNNYDKMKQENPSFPEEAFIFSGKAVFDNELIMNRINYLKSVNNFGITGKFVFKWNNEEVKDYILKNTIQFEKNNKNYVITIYESPIKGYHYVIGGDTKGEGKDWYAATVINNITGNRSATLHMQSISSKNFTWQIYCLAMYYNEALVGIEINFNTAPIEELERLLYYKQYMREVYDDMTGRYLKKFGWKTDGNTRPLIIDKLISLMQENMGIFNNILMLKECLTFAENKNGKPDAMSGCHDDLLFSDMIAQEIRSQQSYSIEKQYDEDEDEIYEELKSNYFD